MIKEFLLAFIPIFVAVDAIGLLPIFTALTQGLKKREKSKVIVQSLMTAFCVAIGFILIGQAIFKFLGITVGDFMVAGGVILFCIAIVDITNYQKHRRIPKETLAIVPLGTPLIAGPAVLTSSLVVIHEYGVVATLLSVTANIAVVGIVLLLSDVLIRIFGVAGSRALSKVTSLFLAAIAVMMMRKGLLLLLGTS